MKGAALLAELRRRRVFRVVGIYAVVAWLVIQVSATVQPFLRLPSWSVTLIIVLLAFGLPIALVLAWAYDLTPEGIRRDAPLDSLLSGSWFARRQSRNLATAIVIVLCLAAGIWLWYTRGLPGEESKSIAVLPFTNLSADRANEYFTDGIHEQVLAQLSQVADLHVISRTSVMQYKQSQRNLREIAEALGASTILEGSVQRERARVRISAQLIDARHDRHLWSETYDRDVTDVFMIQSNIAQEIVNTLRAKLTRDERAVLARPPTRNVEAYDAYLRGSQYPAAAGRGLHVKLDLLRRALALDSSFVLAQIATAHTLLDLADVNFEHGIMPEAVAAMQRAVQLAPAAAETHALIARVKARAGDFDGALAEAAIAREIQPANPEIMSAFGLLLLNRGMHAQALRLMQRVAELDPANVITHIRLARALAAQRRWGEAEQHLDRATAIAPDDPEPFAIKFQLRAAHAKSVEELRPLLEQGIARYDRQALAARLLPGSAQLAEIVLQLRPDFFNNLTLSAGVDSADFYLVTGMVHDRMGRSAEARAAFEKGARVRSALEIVEPRFRNLAYTAWLHSDWALAYAALGRQRDAIAAAERGAQMFPLSQPDQAAIHISWILARVYSKAGRADEAIAVLRRALAAPLAPALGLTAARIRIDPMFAALRARPAFVELTAHQSDR